MATISRDRGGFFDRSGANERRVVPYTGPASYATGGDSFTPEELALGKLLAVLALTITNGTAIRVGAYDYTNKKILWYVPNTGAEVAATVDLSGFTGRFEVIGK